MRAIILAAGESMLLDGFPKLLIKDPITNKTILDHYLEAFINMEVTVVVGYKAMEIINQYPELNYVYNPHWATTNNSGSLSLALNIEPCLVVSDDIFLRPDLIKEIIECNEDVVLTSINESRSINSLNCIIDGPRVSELYTGTIKNVTDPEAIGVYKISTTGVLKQWGKNCMSYPNLLIGENLPTSKAEILYYDLGDSYFFEINTIYDYLRFIDEDK
jgi:choline kinase